jgi:protein-L-isoaspartate(D-aspartate) O-methyltransferase
MVREQIEARGVHDAAVLEAMRRVPRHLFVRPEERPQAYDDHPLPIGFGQTISQPFMVARMTEICTLNRADAVLEVGAGSGYQAAVLAQLARHVFAVEIVAELCETAEENLRAAGIANVTLGNLDGTGGWPEHAPYDVILVSAGAPQVPALLVDQIRPEGGRLVIPVGERSQQVVRRITRHGDRYDTLDDTPCRFVDLIGRYGWGGRTPRA